MNINVKILILAKRIQQYIFLNDQVGFIPKFKIRKSINKIHYINSLKYKLSLHSKKAYEKIQYVCLIYNNNNNKNHK